MILNLLIASTVILLCVLFHKLSSKIGIPMLFAFIGLGMLFGTDGILKIPFENYEFSEQICSIALIFIMFYGGFGTNWSEAKPVALKSILLSTIGVVLTAALTGLFCHFILRFSWLESLLIGSIISSTDAASVFSILRSKNMGLKEHTASMLEIESGSNDPCSYMLTVIILSILNGNAQINSIAYMVFAQFFFGIIIGVTVALLAQFILRRISFDNSGFDMAFVIGTALFSYAFSSFFGGNGYMAAYICGIILGNTKIKNKKSLVHFFDGVTGLMQMLIFFLLGFLATPSKIPYLFPVALSITLFLTFVSRPLSIFSILTPFGCKIRQQLFVSFAGLRGAASVVFAIMASLNYSSGIDIFHIAFCVVLLSISFQGTLLSPCAKKLDMSDENANIMKTFSDYSEEVDLQFITIEVTKEHFWVNQAIKNIPLPLDSLIVMILRNGKTIIPNGKTILAENDKIVLSARVFQQENSLILREQKIEHGSSWIGKKIIDFSPNPEELVIMIIRSEKTIVPKGNTIILEKDILVIHSVS